MAAQQKFFEIIKPEVDIDFLGKRHLWMGISLCAVLASLTMLLVNAFLIPSRGQMLNWGVDFKGGTEILVAFSKPVESGQIRGALSSSGIDNAEVVRYAVTNEPHSFMLRLGAVSVLSAVQVDKLPGALAKVGDASLRSGKRGLEWSEGGDKLYLRFDKAVEPAAIQAALTTAGVNTTGAKPFGRAEEHGYEVTLISLDTEVRKALDAKLGQGAVKAIPQVSSVSAKAGQQLRIDGLKAIVGSILLIVIYIAFRFDFRYGPASIVALAHDAIITIGAFALTYKEFNLTTLAAVLTIIGYSLNDTIVVFDRIRENAARYRDRQFDKVVNRSVNETLSRTILTSATVFFVTLAMNIFGTGVIKDFAFAMNVGVIVGSYSSIFIANPVVIWLNDKYVTAQKKQGPRQPRRPVRSDEEPIEAT